MIRRPPRSPLFPSTTLSRSPDLLERRGAVAEAQPHRGIDGARRHPGQDGGTEPDRLEHLQRPDRKSTRLNSSHLVISYAVFCLKKKKKNKTKKKSYTQSSLA